MRSLLCRFLLAALFLSVSAAFAQVPALDEAQWTTLRDESSGSAPYENLRYLTTLHRVPATPAFDQAGAYVAARAHVYGLEVTSETFPADGHAHYGLKRAYLGWEVKQAQLWQVTPNHTLLADWQTDPSSDTFKPAAVAGTAPGTAFAAALLATQSGG
jgi:hypothetical protein